ncbi:uncharacterized protein [Anabrus simplex]|uniref:uncharacterized protein isoform X2 n=1 Tax=Anabrus simplex TaxID=316456 RepID=UPI0035A39478
MMDFTGNILLKLCEAGKEDKVSFLLEQGASVNYFDDYGTTPIQVAAANGNYEVLNLLQMQGADIEKSNIFGWTPLMHAARNGHLSIVRKLIDDGAEISHTSKLGNTLLSLAAASGNLDIVTAVLERIVINKSSVIWQNNFVSPVCMAALFGHAHLLDLLLNYETYSSSGMTALKLATAREHNSVVRLLMDYGSNLELAGNNTAENITKVEGKENLHCLFQDKVNVSSISAIKDFKSDIKDRYGWSFSMHYNPNVTKTGSSIISDGQSSSCPANGPGNVCSSQQNITTNSNSLCSNSAHTLSSKLSNKNGLKLKISLPLHPGSENLFFSEDPCNSQYSPVIPVPPISPYSNSFHYFQPITPEEHASSSVTDDISASSNNISSMDNRRGPISFPKAQWRQIISTRFFNQSSSKNDFNAMPQAIEPEIQSQDNSYLKTKVNCSHSKTSLLKSWIHLAQKKFRMKTNNHSKRNKKKQFDLPGEDYGFSSVLSESSPTMANRTVVLTKLLTKFELDAYVPLLLEHEKLDLTTKKEQQGL